MRRSFKLSKNPDKAHKRPNSCSEKLIKCSSSGSPKPLLVEKEKPLVVCFGEMLIDFVPSAAGVSLAEAHAFKKAAGGAPANVAVGIARLGGSSAFIGKVGEDEFGAS